VWAGAARAAVAAKEWRRTNRLIEEQWERSVDRAMAAAEESTRDALPGMWAGYEHGTHSPQAFPWAPPFLTPSPCAGRDVVCESDPAALLHHRGDKP
jgi:hypothetical protein